METSEGLLPFVLEKCPLGVLVYDAAARVVYRNARAARFLERHPLPDEIPVITRNIFDALAQGTIERDFPGQVCLSREIGQPPGRWTFKFGHREAPEPLVCVFLLEVTASSQVDLNAVRRDFSLTRRETDLVQHVLDGERNLDISAEFGISEQTVKDHLSNIYRKIGVKNRVALVRLLLNSCYR